MSATTDASNLNTIFGRATVLTQPRESDQIVEYRLNNWTLADGSHPTLYGLTKFLTTTATTPSQNNTATTTAAATTASATTTSTIHLEPTAAAVAGAAKSPETTTTTTTATTATTRWQKLLTIPTTTTPAPPISDVPQHTTVGCPTPKVGGETVMFYNDTYFARIRECFNIPANVVEQTSTFDWANMKPSLGKGGDAMQFTPDRKYIVKELSSDHSALLAITNSYAEHICAGDSLLVRFGLHFKRLSNNKNYILMNSWLPASASNKKDEYLEIYDLKGCADDKMMRRNGHPLDQIHNRCWMMNHKCYPTDERITYSLGKAYARNCTFQLHTTERQLVVNAIQKDSEWLQTTGLMDYSLIVGVKKCSVAEYQECGFSPGDVSGVGPNQPYVATVRDEMVGYYVGIIDFLQFYGCGKKVAHHIKCCDVKPLATVPPTEYATRFVHCLDAKFHAIDQGSPGGRKLEESNTGSSVGMSKGEN